MSLLLQRYQDSNLEMLESESSALPFGDSDEDFNQRREREEESFNVVFII